MEKKKGKEGYLPKLILLGDLEVWKFKGKSVKYRLTTFLSSKLTKGSQHKIIDFNSKVIKKSLFFSLIPSFKLIKVRMKVNQFRSYSFSWIHF